MKVSTVFYTTIAVVAIVASTRGDIEKIRTEEKFLPEKEISIKRTYRGNACILIEMNGKHNKTRSYIINGKNVAVESDEDGDGFFEMFTIFDLKTGEFEMFSRTTNGLVIPLDSQKLQNIRAQKGSADRKLLDLLNSVP